MNLKVFLFRTVILLGFAIIFGSAFAQTEDCTITFSGTSGVQTHPFTASLEEGQSQGFSFDEEEGISTSSFIKSTEGPCIFAVYNANGFEGRFVIIGTDLKNQIRIGTGGFLYRRESDSRDFFNDTIKDLNPRIKNNTEPYKENPEAYLSVYRTIEGAINGGTTWKARSVIIERVSTDCSIRLGDDSKSDSSGLIYYGKKGDVFNSIPAMDFIKEISEGCKFEVYNVTGFRTLDNLKEPKTYATPYKRSEDSKGRTIGYNARSLKILP